MAYLLVGGGASASAESEQGLESGHGLAPPVVAEHELVEVDLKLRAAHSMVRSHEPVLKVADRPVRKRDDGLGALSQANEVAAGFAGGACIRPPPIPRSF